jgi:hypothetical protein
MKKTEIQIDSHVRRSDGRTGVVYSLDTSSGKAEILLDPRDYLNAHGSSALRKVALADLTLLSR